MKAAIFDDGESTGRSWRRDPKQGEAAQADRSERKRNPRKNERVKTKTNRDQDPGQDRAINERILQTGRQAKRKEKRAAGASFHHGHKWQEIKTA